MAQPIDIPSDDAIWIARSLYCKTPEALNTALDTLRGIGYKIEDLRADGYSIREGRATPEEMEQDGWSLWHATLEDITKGKCGSCGSYISTYGIRAHGHACEVCGKPTYLDIIEGSTVKFTFLGNDQRGMFTPSLQMTVERWDDQNGWLYLRREVGEGRFRIMGPEDAETYLLQHTSKWEAIEEDGRQLIKVRYYHRRPMDPVNPATVIDMEEVFGHHFNYKTVKLWDGREYSEWDHNFPLPEYISIFETWHWAPLEPSPTLHSRVLSAVNNTDDKGWHYQDGRPWFKRQTFEEMGKFIRHFTTLDADAWDRKYRMFRLDGPGGIDDVAAFCHPNALVRDEPNIGNFLTAMGDVVEGRIPAAGTTIAAKRAIDGDPQTREFISGLKRRRRK